ncbi:alpha/beta fold hydrolase [Leifsonia poae]|uniref:Alpha/beta hydrolase n=1 Tax=Leifsonia poae TaxID=110933 RepID=A0A9W6HB66_9MICO|nr:alpha/beta hydrolase [Leifsonia poae]GLJ76885.1 alpha/beta hydrolase [Leifsonia poae]
MDDGAELTVGDRAVRYYDTGPVGAAPGGGGLTAFWHHGTPQTGRLLAPVVEAAAERGIRIVSVTRPSYEGSSPLPGRSIAAAARDVLAVADALGIRKFATVGASGGGSHALACAGLAPDRVFAVVALAAVAPYTDEIGWFDGMAADAALRSARESRDARARFAETAEFDESSFVGADWTALEGAWGVLGADAGRAGGAGPGGEIDDDVAYVNDWGVELAEIEAPVLLVQGGLDRVVPAAHAQWMLGRLPRAELWLRPREGHISVLGALPVAFDWIVDMERPA